MKQWRKVFVAVDEFQNFSGSYFDTLLSEDAKYGYALLLATQNLKRLNKIRDGLLDLALSNCQQLCVFRVSAADAKILEEERQEKVTVKHIISQPPMQCYACLAMAGYPLQIISVELAHPASWGNDLARDRLAGEIQRAKQQRHLPVDEVDRFQDEHLHRFLSVAHMPARSNAKGVQRAPASRNEKKRISLLTRSRPRKSCREQSSQQIHSRQCARPLLHPGHSLQLWTRQIFPLIHYQPVLRGIIDGASAWEKSRLACLLLSREYQSPSLQVTMPRRRSVPCPVPAVRSLQGEAVGAVRWDRKDARGASVCSAGEGKTLGCLECYD